MGFLTTFAWWEDPDPGLDLWLTELIRIWEAQKFTAPAPEHRNIETDWNIETVFLVYSELSYVWASLTCSLAAPSTPEVGESVQSQRKKSGSGYRLLLPLYDG